MKLKNKRVTELFHKYLSRTASADETQEFLDYVDDPLFTSDIHELLSAAFENQAEVAGLDDEGRSRVLNNILKQNGLQSGKSRVITLWPRFAAAASIILLLSFGGYFFFRPKPAKQIARAQNEIIAPGKNNATLILNNGQRINLNDAKNGQLLVAAGVKITKDKSGQITYEVLPVGGENNLAVQYNTTQTPRGGQWHMVLADGTNVWLNAASTLRYPTAFMGSERKVELTGEGYFEVAKDKTHPFIVQTPKESIEVIGTHFDVNAYDDEEVQRTTLLEGKVKINATSQPGQDLFLAPGEQAMLEAGLINKKAVDPELAVAWKKGLFYYKSTPLPAVMRQIARWYDVDISYAMDNPQGQTFSGSISRYDNVEALLKAISLTGAVRFKIDGKKITVTQ